MPVTSHLKSLQALDLAIREGSLKGAAEKLGLSPAAVGQRIRTLEDYLGTDLLVRGRSGLRPTAELQAALGDLAEAFEALDRVTETLDFQRVTEIHAVVDTDLAELWLKPRLPAFREEHPNILFCINGEGDVRMRLGAPDIRIEYGDKTKGRPLFTDRLVPVCSADNMRRIADYDAENEMEGMPLLHLEAQRDRADCPGWEAWFAEYGLRETGADRGPHYRHARVALEAARTDVGFLICGLSLVERDLESGALQLPYGTEKSLLAPHPYRLWVQDKSLARPQLRRFVDWLMAVGEETGARMAAI